MHTVGGQILTIGYGDQPWEAFLSRLKRHDVQYLIDVRSRPGSRQVEFNRENLDVLLGAQGVKYVFMGDLLGGMPSDPDCYVDGKAVYAAIREKPFFQRGLERLRTARSQGLRIALLCSELDPERCHRSKLIGAALADEGIDVQHIGREGELLSQAAVIDRLTGGQATFFPEDSTSIGRYQPGGERRTG